MPSLRCLQIQPKRQIVVSQTLAFLLKWNVCSLRLASYPKDMELAFPHYSKFMRIILLSLKKKFFDRTTLRLIDCSDWRTPKKPSSNAFQSTWQNCIRIAQCVEATLRCGSGLLTYCIEQWQ